MARYLTARNPEIVGVDIVEAAWVALGIPAAGLVDDKLVFPLVKQLVPQITANETVGKLADAGTTAASAWGVGTAVGMLDYTIGKRLKYGGVLYAVGKVIASLVPGFSISGTFPKSLPWQQQQALAAANPKALAAGKTDQVGLAAAGSAKNYSPMNDYPRPVAADQSVGL